MVTLAITDIQGSTSLWDKYPQQVRLPCPGLCVCNSRLAWMMNIVHSTHGSQNENVLAIASLAPVISHQLGKAIALHHRCLRACLAECDGYEVATEGDSFKCAFRTPGPPPPFPAPSAIVATHGTGVRARRKLPIPPPCR